MASRNLGTGLLGGVGAQFDSVNNRVVFVEFGGNLSAAPVAAGGRVVLGTGYVQPEDLALTSDGTTAFVSERAGNILKVNLSSADRASAGVVAAGLVAPQQLVFFESAGVIWVVEFSPAGRLLEVNLGTGVVTTLAAGLDRPVGLAVKADRSAAYVTEQSATGGRVTEIAFPSGVKTVIEAGLIAPFFLHWSDPSESRLLVVERDPVNRVTELQVAAPHARRLALLGASFRPSSALMVGAELVVCADSSLDAWDASAGYPGQVKILMPPKLLYVGSWEKVLVDVGSTGVAFDDLDFHVPAGRRGGATSPSRDHTFNPVKPDVMLLAGYRPGGYLLRAIHRPTGAVAGEAKFQTTAHWNDHARSPRKWFNGILPAYTAEAAWGGGPAGTPQNFNTIPALGTKRAGVVFVDTADQRYTSNAATLTSFRTRWQRHLVDGFVGPDGVARSVRQYYREVSYQSIGLAGMDVSATVFPNVVNLPDHWTDYFVMDSNGSWAPSAEFPNQCVTVASDGVDLTGFDMLVFVSQPVDATQVAWPYGGFPVDQDSSHGRVTSRGISMPNTWGDGSAEDQGGGRTIFQTLTHEMGHTIRLPDEYKPNVANRMLADTPAGASWDPMEREATLPHLTLAHRMMLGWTQTSWIKLYNFSAAPGTTVDETVTLSAIENGAPGANKFAGIEVRVGDGRNYYAEFRRGQTGEIGDRQLVPDPRVVVVDVSEPPDPPVISRPDMLLVPKHGDDDGGVLDTGQFYHEVDNTTPTFPSDFRLDVVSHTGNDARVRIRYGVIGKPDPSIRPWPRDPQHQWQSPDIEVRNDRNAADASWANVPWSGHDNVVAAQIKNRGSLSAPGVSASFFVKDYTVTNAPETFLGSDTHDIGPNATVEFTTTWSIPAPADPDEPRHFCIIVRIDQYSTPTTPPVQELTDANNSAQSNYDRFISATSTPSRETTKISVSNPFAAPARVFVSGGQSNPLYRTYLDNTWLRLAAGQQHQVTAMFEYAPEAEQSDPRLKDGKEKFTRLSNFVNLTGAIEDPGDPRLHGPTRVSGVTAEIVTGKSTRFSDLKSGGERVAGVVVTKDGLPVPAGNVIITFRDKKGKTVGSQHSKVNPGGGFAVAFGKKWVKLDAYYVGPHGYADCTAELTFKK